jgi:hypothetical protein
VHNWPEYETALRNRGDLTLWFSEEAIVAWHAPPIAKPGGRQIYSNLAIETALTVRAVYGLGLRQTEGFLRSIATLLVLDIRIPDHSTLSRRSKHLDRLPVITNDANGSVHILVDSTGLKVHRGGHGGGQPRNRRSWRKLHLAVDLVSGEILASALTAHEIHDATPISGLLGQLPTELASLTA